MNGWIAWLQHPAGRRAFYFWWLGRGVLALLVVLPLSRQLSHAVARFPSGEAALFEPGGVMLIETLRLRSEALTAALSSTWILLFSALVASWLLTSGLLSALSGPPRQRPLSWLLRCARWLPAHAMLVLGGWALRVLLLLMGLLLVVSLHHVLRGALNERAQHGLLVGAALLAFVPLLLVQVWLDLARAGLRRYPRPVHRSALLALELLARHPIRRLSAYLLLTVAAYAGMALGALLARQTSLPAVTALAQQLGFFWLCACRASWLWHCTQLSQASTRQLP